MRTVQNYFTYKSKLHFFGKNKKKVTIFVLFSLIFFIVTFLNFWVFSAIPMMAIIEKYTTHIPLIQRTLLKYEKIGSINLM